MATKIAPKHFWVNDLTGVCEMSVTGALGGGRLDKKVKAIFDALPAGSFVRTPKALWNLVFDCDAGKDCYEIKFRVTDPRAVQTALFNMQMGR